MPRIRLRRRDPRVVVLGRIRDEIAEHVDHSRPVADGRGLSSSWR
jgi:hypothetical protein